MTTPTFTTPPTMPSRLQAPASYVANFNAFLAWLAVFFGEMVAGVTWIAAQVTSIAASIAAAAASAAAAAASALSAASAALTATTATGYVATSTDNLAVGTGAKALTGLTGKSFANSKTAALIYRPDPTIRMRGVISLANMGAGTMTVTVAAGGFSGAGTLADWLVVAGEFETLAPASGPDVRAGATATLAVTPKALVDAAAFDLLPYASTIAWDTAGSFNARVTLAGNPIVGAPTNLKDGVVYSLYLTQDATGSRVPSWNAIWDWGLAGAPTLSTAAGKVDIVVAQYSAVTGKLHANFRKSA